MIYKDISVETIERLTKQEQLNSELIELNRVGQQLFDSYLAQELIIFDMSVLDKPLENHHD